MISLVNINIKIYITPDANSKLSIFLTFSSAVFNSSDLSKYN